MANLCSFSMRVRGNNEDIQSFYDALTQKHKVYMGRACFERMGVQEFYTEC